MTSTPSTTPTTFKPTKAIVGGIIATVLAIATGLEGLIPDPTVKLVCQIVTVVLTAAATSFGIYQTTNAPTA
jgi:hypothetical protein